MTDDFRQRCADAAMNAWNQQPTALCEHSQIIPIGSIVDAVLAERDDELEQLRRQLQEAADALCAVGKAAIVVQPTLDKPYPDAPNTSPWKQFMGEPAKRAYNLGHQIRATHRRQQETNHG